MVATRRARTATARQQRDTGHAEPTLQLNRAMRLPEVLLDTILSFSDMRTQYFAVTTSHEFCDSYARLAPILEHQLVLGRFPLLATCVDGRKSSAPAPHQLCEMFSQFFSGSADDARALPPASTVGLETYRLCLELQFVKGATRETVFVGSGTLSPSNDPSETRFRFEVPGGHTEREETSSDDDYDESKPPKPPREAGLERAFDLVFDHGYGLEAKVVATRLYEGRLQFAKLFHGGIGGLDDGFVFEYQNIAVRNDSAAAVAWAEHAADPYQGGRGEKPQLNLYWMPGAQTATESPLHAYFAWGTTTYLQDEYNRDMAASDARMTLEHYVDWK